MKQTDVAKQEESNRRNRILFASFASNDVLKMLLHANFATFATTKKENVAKVAKNMYEICMGSLVKTF